MNATDEAATICARWYCPEPWTVPIIATCVHEHVRRGGLCPEHWQLYLDGERRPVCCPCENGPSGHRGCSLDLIEDVVSA